MKILFMLKNEHFFTQSKETRDGYRWIFAQNYGSEIFSIDFQPLDSPRTTLRIRRNSWECHVEKKISPGNILVSFDVVNCFGNIPTDLAIKLVQEQFGKISQKTIIPEADFMALLKFCLEEANYFSYKGL